jgi:hypothetical protein
LAHFLSKSAPIFFNFAIIFRSRNRPKIAKRKFRSGFYLFVKNDKCLAYIQESFNLRGKSDQSVGQLNFWLKLISGILSRKLKFRSSVLIKNLSDQQIGYSSRVGYFLNFQKLFLCAVGRGVCSFEVASSRVQNPWSGGAGFERRERSGADRSNPAPLRLFFETPLNRSAPRKFLDT